MYSDIILITTFTPCEKNTYITTVTTQEIMQACASHQAISNAIPINGEGHFLRAAFDLVLSLQVSHALSWLPTYGQDRVSNTEVGQGRFTPKGNLVNRGEPSSSSTTRSSSSSARATSLQ